MWTTQSFEAEQNTEKKAPMLPWAAAGPWCCFPFTKKLGATFPECRYVSTSEASWPVWPRSPGGPGQANMALQGPVCWPNLNIAKSGRLCQHTHVAVLTLVGSWLLKLI
jgi:hypothetical protein